MTCCQRCSKWWTDGLFHDRVTDYNLARLTECILSKHTSLDLEHISRRQLKGFLNFLAILAKKDCVFELVDSCPEASSSPFFSAILLLITNVCAILICLNLVSSFSSQSKNCNFFTPLDFLCESYFFHLSSSKPSHSLVCIRC